MTRQNLAAANKGRQTAEERARAIRLLIFDVDGVLTDGTIWFFPTPGSRRSSVLAHTGVGQLAKQGALPPGTAIPPGSMIEVKGFNAHDGIGLVLARRGGLKTGVITKRISESLALRARDLHMDYVRQGVERKLVALREILQESELRPEQVCCMGDDIIDLPMMQNCGLAAAPSNARAEVRASAHFIAEHAGGAGAVRDLIEFILTQQGLWERVSSEYVRQSEG